MLSPKSKLIITPTVARPQLKIVSLRLTLRGWLYGLMSILIGSVGIYRKELASILWGIGIGSIWVFALLFSAWASFLVFRRRIQLLQHLEFTHPKEGLYAGIPLTFSVSLPKEVLKGVGRIPGIILWYQYQVSAFQKRLYGWKSVLDPRNPSFQITPPPPSRGDYQGSLGILRVEDCFRFCRIDILLPEEEHLLILPEPSFHFPLPDLTIQGGTRPRERQPTQATLEELEIRKYIPGDDPRRLHWKLYAHSGELFLRIGEQDPPPLDTYHLHFDPTLPVLLDPILHLEAVDRMASIGARVLLDLSRMGKRILFSTNQFDTTILLPADTPSQSQWFQPPWIEMEKGHPEEGLAELARLSPYSSLTPLSSQGLSFEGTDADRVPTTALSSKDSSLAPVTGRILFLFADSPASQMIRPLQSHSQRIPEPQTTVQTISGESPLWVILIHPQKGPDNG